MDPAALGAIDPTIQMWLTLALVGGAVVLFVTEWVSLELTSLGVLCALLAVFQIWPVPGPEGGNLLGPETLLAGFANPALITVLALLVVGEGLVHTGALQGLAGLVARPRLGASGSVALALLVVAATSAFLNNTPVVVIFIPVLLAVAARFGTPASRVMMPLSYAAILGGGTTLIGSSTNLLVSSVLVKEGRPPLGFFEFTPIALVLVAVGALYGALVLPRLLPRRASMTGRLTRGGKQFVAQIEIPGDSSLVGRSGEGGMPALGPEITVRAVRRDGHTYLPPFQGVVLQPGDTLLVAATRKALADAQARHPGLFLPRAERPGDHEKPWRSGQQLLVEAMIPPASRLVGLSLRLTAFHQRFRCVVLGIERRARTYHERFADIRLEAGDVVLVQGRPEDVEALNQTHDLVVISGSKAPVVEMHKARRAAVAFLLMLGLAIPGLVPIAVAAILAATAMVALGALNLRQAGRALDRQVILLVAAALGLGSAMEATGAAAWLAHSLFLGLQGAPPEAVLSAYFLLVAVFTNLLTNNATAVLFTPIGIALGMEVGVDPRLFAVATVMAANCSFASPMGYQTNLLVMAPGRYRFADYIRAGLPLVLLLWLAFSLAAPLVYGLWKI